jgi:nucleoside-diphosphate-sugar epimerase
VRALVTGGRGFIRSAEARALIEWRDDVRVFESFLTGIRNSMAEDSELIYGDLRNRQAAGSASGWSRWSSVRELCGVPRPVAEPLVTVDDVVEVNLLSAKTDWVVDGTVMNIGGGGKTVSKLSWPVTRALGKWIDPTPATKRTRDALQTRSDISRAADLLGWKAGAVWDEELSSTMRWFGEERAP